ncbi:MAG: cob(I)yrinic acid a,c-diamide adenosyltransferase [Planctomycetota bacterium]|nr:cob(I)yrinic acid a,c-diamide adenosyltransferase [Planctomycetota bacterium]MDA0934238.1 cob(I)yrinic acid a,c-diamide adenosyltransferase [Planctomycetota bacterium]MDA1220571.1 cob(I)yrinic acid a,c-diamide adenosyltransferase [Planctomycetota bacterium]
MRITRVYTRTGDKGSTRLVGGQELAKNAPRIEAYGTVDELNAVLGVARTFCEQSPGPAEAVAEVSKILKAVQNDLFSVGADLATQPADRWEGMYRVGEADVARLESWCDRLNGDLPPLEEFVIPGGGPVGAFLHQARTVCRRSERRLVALMEIESEVGDGCLVYLNRLSDLLFVLSRWAAKALGEPEYQWEQPGSRPGDSAKPEA